MHTHTLRSRLPVVFLMLASLLVLLVGVAYANPPGFDQCANDNPAQTTCNQGWINGNLGSNKSQYFEGDTVPQRITFTGLSANTTYTITFGWDVINSSEHAYDYLTTYNRTVTGADPCTGTGATCATVTTLAIPTDTYLSACQAGGVVSPQKYFGAYPPVSGQVFTFFGDVNTLSASVYSLTTCPTASGTVQNTITLSFKSGSTGSNIVLAYGEHIATCGDWGSGNCAASISGSSYHGSLISCSANISGCGQRDNQLATNAVPPSPSFSTQILLTSVNQPPSGPIAQNTPFYDTLTLNGASGTISGTIAFSLCGPTPSVSSCVSGGTSIPVSGTSAISFTPPPSHTFSSQSSSESSIGYYCFQAKFTSSNANYSSFTGLDTTRECVQVVTATADHLGNINGRGNAHDIRLKWHTVDEVGVLGFNVWRSSQRNGTFSMLNTSPIPARFVGQMRGGKYVYLDHSALPGKTYFYKVEIVGPQGTLEWSKILRVRRPPSP